MRKHGTMRAVIISAITALAMGLPAAAANAQTAALGTPVQSAAGSLLHEICAVYSNGAIYECLNNWNGVDGYVKSYSSGVTNDAFIVEGIDRCGNGDYTTYGCPVKNIPAGLFIYQIEFGDGSGYCVGTDANGNALSTTCNNPNGYDGGIGTLEVVDHGECPAGTNGALNVYWTNKYGGYSSGGIRDIGWTSGIGNQVMLNSLYSTYCLGYYTY